MTIEHLLNRILNPFGFYAEKIEKAEKDHLREINNLLSGDGEIIGDISEESSVYTREATAKFTSETSVAKYVGKGRVR